MGAHASAAEAEAAGRRVARETSVAVLGGGVAGLSAAHELAERGFEVTACEQRDAPGGRARRMLVPGSGTDGRADLPASMGSASFRGSHERAGRAHRCARDRLRGRIAARELSAEEVVAAHVERIGDVDGATNAVVQIDAERTPGGSSAGEAAIVAAQGSPCGVGTDSGASLRLPAHFCGLACIKPTATA